MDNLFKTDGIRGLSQIELTPLLFHKLGIYLALNSNLPIGLGYDTRESSILYKNIISTTINSLGKDVYDFGIVTTPCLNYLSKELHCEYGVMITASHNPYQYNGIKIFDNNGKKIDIFLQEEISNFIKTFKSVKFYPKSIGKTFDKHKDVNNYINFIISKFNFIKILNKEIILDASNGSGSLIFKNIIEKLGFNNFISKNDCPNGQNINKDCGSTYLENDKNKEMGALKVAEDAIVVDGTHGTIEENVQKVIEIINKKKLKNNETKSVGIDTSINQKKEKNNKTKSVGARCSVPTNKNKIKQNLYNKGIEKSIIETAIDDIDTDKEFENALYLGKKRYERLKNEDSRKAYQKIGNHLAYKGFNYDIIKKVLNKLFNDVDEYSC